MRPGCRSVPAINLIGYKVGRPRQALVAAAPPALGRGAVQGEGRQRAHAEVVARQPVTGEWRDGARRLELPPENHLAGKAHVLQGLGEVHGRHGFDIKEPKQAARTAAEWHCVLEHELLPGPRLRVPRADHDDVQLAHVQAQKPEGAHQALAALVDPGVVHRHVDGSSTAKGGAGDLVLAVRPLRAVAALRVGRRAQAAVGP
mmetsp:Transcript_102768/g.273314  ORF Transcript_102768/g.273314 Transcript_102768/m.273314 type:complete len:202 (-) Transcript_102768:353-958(-)